MTSGEEAKKNKVPVKQAKTKNAPKSQGTQPTEPRPSAKKAAVARKPKTPRASRGVDLADLLTIQLSSPDEHVVTLGMLTRSIRTVQLLKDLMPWLYSNLQKVVDSTEEHQ
jgi:sRNA-binding protein